MVLKQKQIKTLIDGLEREWVPVIRSILHGVKTYNTIYIGSNSIGRASGENIKYVNSILLKRGLPPITTALKLPGETGTEAFKIFKIFKTPGQVPIGLPTSQPAPLPVGSAAAAVENQTPAGTAIIAVQPNGIATIQPANVQVPPIVQPPPAAENPALTNQTPPGTTPPPAYQPPPLSLPDPPDEDRELIERATGLSDMDLVKRYGDKGMLAGTVQATGVLTKIVDDQTWQFKVTAELGRVIMYESMKHLTLDGTERDKPELAVKKIESWIHGLVAMKYHADVLDEVMYENEVARKAIGELQRYAETSALAYETVTTVLCDRCKKRAMWALAIKSVGGEHLVQKEEVVQR